MSKQDIEKRLGFAAQGVKAEMASIPGITDLPYEANPQGTHRYKVGDQVKDKRHPSFQGTIKRLMRDKYGYPSYVVYTQGGGPQDAQDSDLVLASRPGVKAKMALTIYTVGAKNACYEALANLKALAKLASDTKSGWDFHVTAIIDHVKSAMSQLESSPAQAGTHLERAINTLGMLRKIDPVRLNDIQKGSLKQLIGYVAKSLRDARANIKVVTTASRPGAKAKFAFENDVVDLMSGMWSNEVKAAMRFFNVNERTVKPQHLESYFEEMLENAEEAKDVKAQNKMKLLLREVKRARSYASRPGAKAKMSKATDALAFIKSSIESGKTVYIQTPRGATKVTPKTYAKFEALGRPLFKIGTDGALLMSSGSSYNRLTMGEDEMLVRVSAMSRPGVKAKA